MPIYERMDKSKNKPYFQYGATGTKYYYIRGSKKSRDAAYHKALQQNNAIHASEARKKR